MMLLCLTTGDVNLGYLVKMVSARFFYYKVTSYSFSVNRYLEETLNLCKYPVSFSHSPNPTQISTSESYWQQILLWCFTNGDFLFPSFSVFINQNYFPPFVYSIFYFYQSVFMGIYFILLVTVQYCHYLFCCPNYSSFGLCPFDKLPCFFEHLPTFWNLKMLQAYFEFSLLQIGSQLLQQGSPGSFNWRMVIRNQNLSARCVHCHWVVLASRPFRQIELAVYSPHLPIPNSPHTCM